MNKSAEFLDKCKEKLNISTTYALAKKLDVDESGLRNYYAGRRVPDEFMCFKIAETLELDPAYVIASIKAETEKNENKKNYFRSFSGVSRKVAASIVLAVALSSSLLTGLQSGAYAAKTAMAVFLRRRYFV